jgi:hypothetical protein
MDDDADRALAEINRLDGSTGTCQWDKGCTETATHNVCQYDPITTETLPDGVDANYCEPHARAMKVRLEEWE